MIRSLPALESAGIIRRAGQGVPPEVLDDFPSFPSLRRKTDRLTVIYARTDPSGKEGRDSERIALSPADFPVITGAGQFAMIIHGFATVVRIPC